MESSPKLIEHRRMAALGLQPTKVTSPVTVNTIAIVAALIDLHIDSLIVQQTTTLTRI